MYMDVTFTFYLLHEHILYISLTNRWNSFQAIKKLYVALLIQACSTLAGLQSTRVCVCLTDCLSVGLFVALNIP